VTQTAVINGCYSNPQLCIENGICTRYITAGKSNLIKNPIGAGYRLQLVKEKSIVFPHNVT